MSAVGKALIGVFTGGSPHGTLAGGLINKSPGQAQKELLEQQRLQQQQILTRQEQQEKRSAQQAANAARQAANIANRRDYTQRRRAAGTVGGDIAGASIAGMNLGFTKMGKSLLGS